MQSIITRAIKLESINNNKTDTEKHLIKCFPKSSIHDKNSADRNQKEVL